MPLPLIPLPRTDEWLGHWLLRIADRYGLSPDGLLHRLNVHPAQPPYLFTWLHTVKWSASEWQDFARQAHIEIHLAQAMQAVVLALGRGSEVGFCPSCVLDAVAGGHPPVWRRAWMDATTTWCEQHRASLVVCPNVAQLAYRTCAAVRRALPQLAQTHRDATAAWLEPLARDAAGLYPAPRSSPSPQSASASQGAAPSGDAASRFHSLINHVLVRLVSIVEDYDEALFLADNLGAPSPEELTHPKLPKHKQVSRAPALAQIRSLSQRIWLLGTAARIIGPSHASPSFLTESTDARKMLRSWLWTRFEAWFLVELVRAVREATAAKLMEPWPAAQAWKSPSTGAGWFRRMETAN